MNAGRVSACALFIVLLFPDRGWSQAGAAPTKPAAAPEVPEDPLGRNTPRGTVRGFLSENGKEDAARYLDTRYRGEGAATIARELTVVLNRRLLTKLNDISDRPEGSLLDPRQPDREVIGSVHSDTGNVEITLQRFESPKAGAIWLFSAETLKATPEVYAETVEAGESKFTKFLVETKVAHIALVQWLGVFIGLPLLYFLSSRINILLRPLAGRLRRSIHKDPNLPNPEVLPMPVRLLLLAVIIRWGLAVITLPLLAREFWSSIAVLALIVGGVWLLIRLNRLLEAKLRLRLGQRNQTGALSMLRFIRWALDGLAMFIGLLVALRYFGINATTAVAGLGVGGIAVALAAQKTLENVIAGISLISDKAIRVGDFLKLDNTQGTVMDIGLRSTRIRTLDRTVVSVPNGQIANATLENMSLRDQFWFHPILHLTYETTAQQLRSILAGLNHVLLKHPSVHEPSVRTRFLGFGESSLDVEVFSYFYASDWADFLRIQEELLLEIMDLVQAAGAKIALPSRIMYVNTPLPVRIGSDFTQDTMDDEGPRPKTRRLTKPKLEERGASASPLGD